MTRYVWNLDERPGYEGGYTCPTLRARLAAGEGAKFRLLDDDGQVYFHGRFLSADPDPSMGEEYFAPLDYYGEGYGCTSIEYKGERGRWEVL